MAQASKIVNIEVSDDDATWIEVPNSSGTLNTSKTIQGIDNFRDVETNNCYREKIATLKDWSLDFSAFFEGGASTWLTLIHDNYEDSETDDLFIRFQFDGTASNQGQGQVLVENFTIEPGEVDGVTGVSVSLQGQKALTKTFS